jgi:excisionase family DNA binding protein
VNVPTTEDFTTLAARVAELERRLADSARRSESPYMTIMEAAELLRCSRQRVDDLLSQHRLARYKYGARTLINRAEVEEQLRKHRR